MRIYLLIGPTELAASRFRAMLKATSETLEKHSIYAPDWNHVRIHSAVADPDQIGIVQVKRGFDSEAAQHTLFSEIKMQLASALERITPKAVVFSAAQFGSLLSRPSELKRLKALLAPLSDDIRIVAHVDEQARLLAQHYADSVMVGRQHPLDREIDLLGGKRWWDGALAMRAENQPLFGLFNDVQHPPFWLDYASLIRHWESVFGKGSVTLRPLDADHLMSAEGAAELGQILELGKSLGKVTPEAIDPPHAAASVTRVRHFNGLLIRYCQVRQISCPMDLWRQMAGEMCVAGAPVAPGSLFAISDHFKPINAKLIKRFADLATCLTPDAATAPWQEAEPTMGFRASQYLAAFGHRIRVHSTSLAEKQADAVVIEQASDKFDEMLREGGDTADEVAANQRLLATIKGKHQVVMSTQIKPHNKIGSVNEEALADAYAAVPLRDLPAGSSGNVIVGCMKNEAPYIVEWVAYHRAIGVDNFLIYTNDCTDGTDEVLGRLQQMGVVQLRNNDKWKGNSPQQHALNQSLKEPLIINADWIIHIDVDEFMNVRTGNGTLNDLFAAVPDATNIAMTWRLFGHNGITRLNDDFVIEQFDTCAPKYCPKPHTVWGFKTMFRNIGAYSKISCHRPNKLLDDFADKVKWVNGSGKDITGDLARNGWRSSKKNVGYDLLQLNHYALRSAESFLIKRQRGRALHVDRSIGINYWIRMDWCDFKDITIKRNIPRVRAEYDRLMADDMLRGWHEKGLDWHRAKAKELHAMPEFRDLYEKALDVKLNETERVAYALSLDMES